jgi:hypothetical protein
MITTLLTAKMQIAEIRKDHARDIFSIIKFVQMEKRTPPAPEPAAQIPIARARRLLNHWLGNGAAETNKNPIPTPNMNPWVRKSCHILSEIQRDGVLLLPMMLRGRILLGGLNRLTL